MQSPPKSFGFDAIGTRWTIDVPEPLNDTTFKDLQAAVHGRIDEFDKTYSRFRGDSLVAAIAKRPGAYTFPEDAAELFAFYKAMYVATDGKVTPLVGNLLADAGYDANYSLHPAQTLLPSPTWEAAMEYTHPNLTTKLPVLLDFGAAGKGYLVDLVASVMESNNIHAYAIDAGGDMLQKRPDGGTMRIGLEHPTHPAQTIGVVLLGNGSLCGSAINRRKWAHLHHIMDPHTAAPAQNIIATWATAKTALIADGMATALFFAEPMRLQRDFAFEYCIVRSDFSVNYSADFPAELFTEARP